MRCGRFRQVFSIPIQFFPRQSSIRKPLDSSFRRSVKSPNSRHVRSTLILKPWKLRPSLAQPLLSSSSFLSVAVYYIPTFGKLTGELGWSLYCGWTHGKRSRRLWKSRLWATVYRWKKEQGLRGLCKYLKVGDLRIKHPEL